MLLEKNKLQPRRISILVDFEILEQKIFIRLRVGLLDGITDCMLIYPKHAVTCFEDHLTFQTIEKSQILLLDTGYQHTFFAELDKLKCLLFIDRNNFLPKGFYITFDLACTCNNKQMVVVSEFIMIFCFQMQMGYQIIRNLKKI